MLAIKHLCNTNVPEATGKELAGVLPVLPLFLVSRQGRTY